MDEHGGASIGSGRRGSAAPFLVWALFGAVAVAIFVTYSHLPAKELWSVSGSGPLAGAGRVLVFTNYSLALAAVMILVLLLDRLRERRLRVLALVAIGLCGVGPVFVDSSDLDARPLNALAAVGVAIAFVLALAARSPSRPAADGWDRGDWARLALGLVLLVMTIPAIAADLGLYLDRVPVLGSLFQTGALRHEPGVKGLHVAVHHGHHEGLDGALVAWSALILWRCLPTVAGRRLRGLFGAVLAAMLCYGVADTFGDFWLEQIVKRGWTDWNPEFLYPALAPRWGVVFGIAAVIWALAVLPGLSGRPGRRGGGPHARFPKIVGLIVLALAAAAVWPAASIASGRPDIEKVVVSRDRAGMLTFAIGFASPTTLGPDTKLQIMLDTDRDSGTGKDGSEYALDYSSSTGARSPAPALIISGEGVDPSATPEFTSTPRSATFRVSVYDIGDPDVFDFWVFVEVDGDLVDAAPVSVFVQPWTYPEEGTPGPGQAWPTDTYEALGDTTAATGRPDIEKVVVSRDRAGMLTFAIGFASSTTLGPDTKLQIMLDTDRDSSTGSEGSEYALDYSSSTGLLPPTPALIVSGGGVDLSVTPEFTSTPRSATFRVSVSDIGDPDVFDFWVFVQVGDDLVETAPTHVVISTYAQPWTYPEDGAPSFGQAWPRDTYEDISDGSLETANIPWVYILLGIVGVAALLGFGGAAYDRWFRDRRPPRPSPAGSNGANGNGHAGTGGGAMQMQSYEGAPAANLQAELLEARDLIDRQPKKALKVAEHVRGHALATSDVPGAIEAWRVAADVYHGSSGKPQQQAGRIAFDCKQNVRTMMRDQAVATGRTYHDPFPPARTVQITSHTGPPSLPRGFLGGHDLLRGLFLSLLFCSGLIVFAALGASSADELNAIALACGAYWLLFAALQVFWRRQGREHFWRPVYPTVLFLAVLVSLIFIPLLLVPRFRRWLFGNMRPGPAR